MAATDLHPNPDYDIATQMLEAADLVKEAAGRLDRRQHTCDKCRRQSYHNWTHERIGKQLDDMVLKLGRLADQLIRKGG